VFPEPYDQLVVLFDFANLAQIFIFGVICFFGRNILGHFGAFQNVLCPQLVKVFSALQCMFEKMITILEKKVVYPFVFNWILFIL